MKYFSADLKFNLKNKLPNSLISMTLKVIEIGDKIDENLPKNSPNKGHNSKLIYDTSGLKPKVKENNPKTLVSEINKQKAIDNKDFNPYAAAYKNMPKSAEYNPNIN